MPCVLCYRRQFSSVLFKDTHKACLRCRLPLKNTYRYPEKKPKKDQTQIITHTGTEGDPKAKVATTFQESKHTKPH